MQVGSGTDIGGGRENQDDFLVFSKPSLGIFVGCVFDGHGREVGKIAANAARIALLKFCEERINDLVTDPATWLVAAHDHAHYFIKDSFREELELQGFEIMEDERGGFLLKRKASTQSWACVHGGSSCSIVVIKGVDMYIGNVGDSSAILCSTSSVLSPSFIEYVSDSALAPSSPLLQLRGSLHSQYLTVDESAMSDTLVITAEHSPESPYEFYRLREFRPRENDAMQPSLLVVYDSPSHEKSRCSPVFDVDTEGKVQVTNMGK